MNVWLIVGFTLIVALLGFAIAKTVASKSKNSDESLAKKDLNKVSAVAPDEDTVTDAPPSPEKEKKPAKKKAGKTSKAPALNRAPPIADQFFGHASEITELQQKIRQGGVVISTKHNAEGMGKTTLALKLVAGLAPRFKDGLIFLNLRGSCGRPLSAWQALCKIIWALRPEMRLPDDEQEVKDIYRSLLEGKKVLLVLDDAKGAGQVQPLIPPKTCSAIVTTQQGFSPPGFSSHTLGPLTPQEAKEMLTALAPESRVLADEITRLCNFVPMALFLIGRLLATAKEMTPVLLSSKLRTRRQNLEKTEADPINAPVEAAIQISFSSLRKATAFVLPKLTLFPESFDAKAEEFVCQDPNNEHLNILVRRALVLHDKKTKRHFLHPLVRAFAEKNLTDASKASTAKRHATYYLTVTLNANEHLEQNDQEGLRQALELFDLEWENISEGHAWAERMSTKDSDATSLCCAYPDAGCRLLDLRQPSDERIEWLKTALSASREMHDRDLELEQLTRLGHAFLHAEQPREALNYFEPALEIARNMSDAIRESALLDALGLCSTAFGDYRKAIEFYEQAREIFKENEDQASERNILSHQGNAYMRLDEAQKAIGFFEDALKISEATGDRRARCADLDNLGRAYDTLEQYDRAIGYHEQALKIHKELGNHIAQALSRWQISLALMQLGDREQAVRRAKTSLKILQQARHDTAQKVREKLAEWTAEDKDPPSEESAQAEATEEKKDNP